MDVFTVKLSIVQVLQSIHSLIVVGHVYKSKIFYHSTLCDCTVLLKEFEELVITSLLNIGHVKFDRALVLAVAGLYVHGCSM